LTKLKAQYCVKATRKLTELSPDQPDTVSVILSYTRNDAGGLKDAIDFLIGALVVKGLDATTVKGSIPRPKSDSFEDNFPFFESRLLYRSEPSSVIGTDSPTRSQFGEASSSSINERPPSERGSGPGSFFSKFRKPGSMSSFSSFIGRNHRSHTNGSSATNPGGTHSPAGSSSFFKHASSNASKASLQSMESRDSGYRNFWNDSGISLAEHHLEEEPSTAGAVSGMNGHAGSGPGLGRGAYYHHSAQHHAHGTTPTGTATWPPMLQHGQPLYGLHSANQNQSLHGFNGPSGVNGSNTSLTGGFHQFAVQNIVPGDVTPTTTTPALGSAFATAPGSSRFDHSLHGPRPGTSHSAFQHAGSSLGFAGGHGAGAAPFPSPGVYSSFAGLKISPAPIGAGTIGQPPASHAPIGSGSTSASGSGSQFAQQLHQQSQAQQQAQNQA
jgi:hypothetical protein